MQVVQATVIPDDRSMLRGALKIAPESAQAQRALYRELKAYARLLDQCDVPKVLAWAATADGKSVAAILFDRLPGTLEDEIQLRLKLRMATKPWMPYPTRDAPLYKPHEYWPMIRTLAALLAVAHSRGIIHADIKPANILLDEDRSPKLADWGIYVKPVRGRNGPTRTIRGPYGTDGYCFPELTAGVVDVPVHFSMDTQALALTVVEMLLGMVPDQAREVYEQGELGDYLPPGDIPLRTLILSSLRRNPVERVPLATWLKKLPWGHCVAAPQVASLAAGAAPRYLCS